MRISKREENPQRLKEGRGTTERVVGGSIFGSPGSLPRKPSPHQLPRCKGLPLSPTRGPVLLPDGTFSETCLQFPGMCKPPRGSLVSWWVVTRWHHDSNSCLWNNWCLETECSVQDKVARGRSLSPQETGQRNLNCHPSLAPPGKAELSVTVSGIKQCLWPWIINLYGSQKYSNKSEIFA